VSANQKGNNAHRNRVFKEGLHPPAKAKHKVRLTPTTHCNLERQIQLCLSCTVLCPALGITVSPTHTFARQTHLLLPALSGPPHTAPPRRHRGPPLLPLRLLRHHSPSPLLCSARIYAVSSRWVEAKATRGRPPHGGPRRRREAASSVRRWGGRRWRGAAGVSHGFGGGGVHRSVAGAPSSLRQSSLLSAASRISHGQPHARPPPFLLLPDSPCPVQPPPHGPLPRVACPTLLLFAFEERGSESLHLLSHR
jgi:hypothetical protein